MWFAHSGYPGIREERSGCRLQAQCSLGAGGLWGQRMPKWFHMTFWTSCFCKSWVPSWFCTPDTTKRCWHIPCPFVQLLQQKGFPPDISYLLQKDVCPAKGRLDWAKMTWMAVWGPGNRCLRILAPWQKRTGSDATQLKKLTFSRCSFSHGSSQHSAWCRWSSFRKQQNTLVCLTSVLSWISWLPGLSSGRHKGCAAALVAQTPYIARAVWADFATHVEVGTNRKLNYSKNPWTQLVKTAITEILLFLAVRTCLMTREIGSLLWRACFQLIESLWLQGLTVKCTKEMRQCGFDMFWWSQPSPSCAFFFYCSWLPRNGTWDK